MSGSGQKKMGGFAWGIGAVFAVIFLLGMGYKFGKSLKKDAPKPSESLAAESPGILRITDIDFSSYSREIAHLVDLQPGEDFAVSQTKMEAYFVPGKGVPGKAVVQDRRAGPSEVSFSTFGALGGTVIVADRFNMADDSVKAEQMYAISKKQDDGSEMLVDFGMKLKCWRGEDPDAWGTDLCL